jgi:hypothetical protein
MPVAQKYRPWDLRSYTGQQLALMSGRKRTYGYRSTERFLNEVAEAGGSESLTDALARWTYGVWGEAKGAGEPATYYVDGHHKAVYSEKLIPRGLVGRLGKVLGCRGLVLLHDDKGHPLLALTSRGDQHLTRGLPEVVTRFEKAVNSSFKIERLVVDREVMAEGFLASQQAEQRVIVTILKENQHSGIGSFQQLGEFKAWLYAKRDQSQVVREVAPALFELSVTSPLSGQPLKLKVALIRDFRRQKHANPAKVEPKLIPIVSTSLEKEVTPLSPEAALALATAYRKRWPLQENIIKDWLLEVGLDLNHGFGKTEVVNSEVAKKREKLQQGLETALKRAVSARERSKKAGELSNRRRQHLKVLVPKLNRKLNKRYDQMWEEAAPHIPTYEQKAECKALERQHNAQVQRLEELEWQAHRTCNQEYRKLKNIANSTRSWQDNWQT